MSLTITYDSNFSSYDGLKDYFAYFDSNYQEGEHADNLAFEDGPGSDLDIGGTTYDDAFMWGVFGNQIGHHLTNTTTSTTDASFVIEGGDITLEDGSGNGYVSDDMIYTLFTNPTHTLAGAIESLTFGDGAYGGGSLASNLFTIEGLADVIGNGMLDTDSDGAYDEIIDHNSSSDDNLVHDLIYDLMGSDDTDTSPTGTLESILNANDITYVGTSSSETFDSFQGDDIFTGNGGDDTYVFTTDFGEDTITDFSSGDSVAFDSSVFTSNTDVLNASYVVGGSTYIEYDANNVVELSGYTSLSSSDIAIV